MMSRVIRNTILSKQGLTSRLILKTTTTTVLSHHFRLPSIPVTTTFKRCQSSATLPNKIEGELLLQFTCNVCNNRSSHNISKQAYDHGTVVAQCPSCKTRHLIADNLGFMEYNKKFNLLDYLNSKGESIETNPSVIEFNDLPEEFKNALPDDAVVPEQELSKLEDSKN